MKFALVTLAAAAAALVGAASPGSADRQGVDASATARACFRTNDMRNHTFDGDRTVYVSTTRDVYRIGMAGSCTSGATNSDTIIVSTVGGSGIVCRPIDLDLHVQIGGAVSPCIVDSIQRLTPAETAALPPKLRP